MRRTNLRKLFGYFQFIIGLVLLLSILVLNFSFLFYKNTDFKEISYLLENTLNGNFNSDSYLILIGTLTFFTLYIGISLILLVLSLLLIMDGILGIKEQ